MKPTTTVSIGYTPQDSAGTFIAGLENLAHQQRVAILHDGDAASLDFRDTGRVRILRAVTVGGRRTHRIFEATYKQLADGLTEWAEQALTHIEDTPDAWLRNALAIAAGRWSAVDHTATDWITQVIATYIAENHATAMILEDPPF